MVAGVSSPVFINEFHYDNDGTDTGEFVEIANPTRLDLTGWVLTLYNGSNGTAYNSIDLSGNAAFFTVNFPSNGIQNGAPDGLALSNGGSLVQFLSYEGSFTASGGPADGQMSTDIGVEEPGSTPIGQSLQLTGSGAVYGDFSWAAPAAQTPEAANNGQSFTGAADPLPAVIINEYRIAASGDSAGANDFVELLGTPGQTLSGLTLVALSGDFAPGQIDVAVPLDGLTFDADGIALVANPMVNATFEAGDLQVAGLNFFNSAQTLLIVQGFTGTVGDDLDTDNDGTLDTVPWSAEVISLSLADQRNNADVNYSGDVFDDPDSTFVSAGGARNPDGTGGFVATGFSSTANDTPGALNVPEDEPIELELTPIFEIQGAAHTSPLLDTMVRTVGVVTAVDSNGFYLQDRTGDGNIATSDAVFVFTGSAPGVVVGNEVEVTGTVSEFFPGGAATGNLSTTQIGTSPANVTVLTDSVPLPAAVVLGVDRMPPTQIIDDDLLTSFDPETDGIDFFESLEAMLVTVNQPRAVAGTNRFGEIYTVVNQGAEATNLSERGTINVRGQGTNLGTTDIGPDDDYNPERIQIDPDSTVTPGGAPDVTTGALLGNVTGVVGYGFGNFEVIPTEAITVLQDGTLTEQVTTLTGAPNRMTIATYNVLNLDPNDADGDTDVADGKFVDIATDIVNSLQAPDIIALQEIQDNSGQIDDGVISASETLQILVDEIAAAGGPDYQWIDNTFITNNASGGAPGANIRTAFLYNPDRVALVEGSVQTIAAESQTQPDGAFNGARLPLVATFAFSGSEFLVVNNHFSSKGGSTPLFGTVQPSVNGSFDERLAQAQAVADFVAANEAGFDGTIVLGDLNEFEYEDPLDPLYDAGLLNLTNTLPEEERYSFVFDGNSQMLDHIFISSNIAAVTEFEIVHVNVEFAASEAASDHEPLIAAITVGDPLKAAADTARTVAPAPVVIDVLANDSEGEGVAIAAIGAAAGGTIVENDDGTLTYTPNAGFTGIDSFEYTIEDDLGGSASATVTVQVAADNGGAEVIGDETDETLAGNAGDDFINGGAGSDFLAGLAGSDLILGSDGDDYLLGGKGNDVIRGGAGADYLYGGMGDNIFVFGEGDLGADIDETDQITAFGLFGLDLLDFSEIDAIVGGDDDAFTFIGEDAFSGTAGELRFERSASFTDIYGDTDGDGVADIALRIFGQIELDASAIIA